MLGIKLIDVRKRGPSSKKCWFFPWHSLIMPKYILDKHHCNTLSFTVTINFDLLMTTLWAYNTILLGLLHTATAINCSSLSTLMPTCSMIVRHVTDVQHHTMDMLWEKLQWILPLYMKPISYQSKASVVCSVTAAVFIDFCLKKLNVFSQHIGKKQMNIWILQNKSPGIEMLINFLC